MQPEKKQSATALSVVIPMFNSGAIFPELYRRLITALEFAVASFEIVVVIDGCRDNSAEVVEKIAEKDSRLKFVEFSRNFGHQAAISAGLQLAGGDVVAVMDDDLEDPPELLPKFLSKLAEGHDVVYGIRRTRHRAWPYRLMFKFFYRLLGYLVSIRMPYDAGDFCVMRRHVVENLNAMPESNRYLRGMRAWCGFAQAGLEYDREGRFANRSGYTLRKYLTLALDAVFSFSYKPLKFVTIAGFVIAACSCLYALRLVLGRMAGEFKEVPGWAHLEVSVLVLASIQLISIGVMGEYLARIYDEVKQRPKFVVKKTQGFGGVKTDD